MFGFSFNIKTIIYDYNYNFAIMCGGAYISVFPSAVFQISILGSEFGLILYCLVCVSIA